MRYLSLLFLCLVGCSEEASAPLVSPLDQIDVNPTGTPDDLELVVTSPLQDSIPEYQGPTVAADACLSGVVIIGEGEFFGELELLGCNGTLSVLLPHGDDGKYRLPLVEGREYNPDYDAYFLLGEKDSPPVFYGYNHGDLVVQGPLYPVLGLSYMATAGKLTPWIMPGLFSPYEVVKRQRGQLVGEGAIWSILTREEQIEG
jgi:hypothetical protein